MQPTQHIPDFSRHFFSRVRACYSPRTSQPQLSRVKYRDSFTVSGSKSAGSCSAAFAVDDVAYVHEEEGAGTGGENRKSHIICHTSHTTSCTSHITCYTSHVTRHISHVTRHTIAHSAAMSRMSQLTATKGCHVSLRGRATPKYCTEKSEGLRLVCHTSHVTRHTSHVTRHTLLTLSKVTSALSTLGRDSSHQCCSRSACHV